MDTWEMVQNDVEVAALSPIQQHHRHRVAVQHPGKDLKAMMLANIIGSQASISSRRASAHWHIGTTQRAAHTVA